MEQLEWTHGGIHLLKTVNDFIDRNGGRINLLKLIREEERTARRERWKTTYVSPISRDRTRKRVTLRKGKARRYFNNPYQAAVYLGRSADAIRSGATKGHRVNGWVVSYVRKYLICK